MVFTSGVSTDCIIAGCDEPALCEGLCRSHYDRRRYSGRPVTPPRNRICPMCGFSFPLERASKRFCSDRCRKRYQRERAKHPGVVAVSYPIIEAKLEIPVSVRSMTYDSFSENDVWVRSGGVCFRCGLPVSRDVDDPDAGTPGWIVPPEDGGDPSFSNRAVFHYRCLRRHAEGVSERDARHGRKAGVADGGKRKKGGAS